MEPRGEGRYCARCEHVVLDLSRMTRRDAEKRIAKETGRYVCVRMAVNDDGEAVFRPAAAPVKRLAGGLVLVAALTAGGCRDREPSPAAEVAMEVEPCAIDPDELMMPGAVAVPEPEPVVALEHEVDPEDAAVPTPEQRELTRRKQEARNRPPIRHMVAGRMPLHRF